jgi:hypothetical protein
MINEQQAINIHFTHQNTFHSSHMCFLNTRDLKLPRAQRFVSREQGRGEGRLLFAALSVLYAGSVWTDDVPSS